MTREVSETRDGMGRITARETVYHDDGVIMRRDRETFEYVVASLDAGDGSPPQYLVRKMTERYEGSGGPGGGVMRLVERLDESMSLHEAQRQERERQHTPPSGGSIARPTERRGFDREPLHSESPFPPPTPPSRNPTQPIGRFDSDEDWERARPVRLPTNDEASEYRRLHELQMLIASGAISEEAARAVFVRDFPPRPIEQAATNAQIVHRSPHELLPLTIEQEHVRRILDEPPRSTCALEKGCNGFCGTCKRCAIHCTCPKQSSDDTPTRRIRL